MTWIFTLASVWVEGLQQMHSQSYHSWWVFSKSIPLFVGELENLPVPKVENYGVEWL